MDEQKFSFSGSYQKSKEYVDTQIELFKLKAIAKMSRILGAIVLDATKLLLAVAIIFFWSLALGFWLGELLGSYSLGFLATGCIFLVLIFIIKAIEPKLEAKFMDLTISKILSKWNQEETYESVLNEEPSENEKKENQGNPTVKEMFETVLKDENKN